MVRQDLFHRLGDPMSGDSPRPVPRQQPDQKPADHRHRDHPSTRMSQRRGKPVVWKVRGKTQVRNKMNQPDENLRHQPGRNSDEQGKQADVDDAGIDRGRASGYMSRIERRPESRGKLERLLAWWTLAQLHRRA